MRNGRLRRIGAACALGLLLVTAGCHRKRRTRSAPKSEDYAGKLRPIVAAKQLKVLHWPDFSDYQPLVQTFYDDRNFEVAWIENNKPTAQATAFIDSFQHAELKGLNPEDYDASLWPARVQKLAARNEDDIATFDAAMTVSVMRFISDLRVGRVNPTHFNFDIDTQEKKYDLPEFVSDNAVDATDVPRLIRSVEPDSDQYRKTEDALARYLNLARRQAASPDLSQPLPTLPRPIAPGATYAAAEPLQARLQLEGDLPGLPPEPAPPAPAPQATAPPAAAPPASRMGQAFNRVEDKLRNRAHHATPVQQHMAAQSSATPVAVVSSAYTPELAAGVRHFQARHGITADGKLNAQTVAALNVPLTDRVKQLNDSLERWRWLPNEYLNAPLMVNLPEFVLRGFDQQHHLDFTMKVVVGKVLGDHDTPVFTHMMKYLIFRPYWNVPISIIKKELTPHLDKSGIEYLASKNFETVDTQGNPVTPTVAQVERGGVIVREKPGPKNSLGLIKFMFPNEYDIYLHSTPQPELFERTRRDFSHGCVRVQKPVDLAVWVLRNQDGDWNTEKVQEAMDTGPDNHQVSLKKAIPIVIFYATANVGDDGQVYFFDDLYGYDKQLEEILAKGMPYPGTTQKVHPTTQPGDTN